MTHEMASIIGPISDLVIIQRLGQLGGEERRVLAGIATAMVEAGQRDADAPQPFEPWPAARQSQLMEAVIELTAGDEHRRG